MALPKFRIRAMAAAVEASYGVDETPTAGANAIEIVDGTIQPLAGEEVEHAYDRADLGNYLSVLVNKHIMITGKVAFAGAGAAGDVPAVGPLLQACAHSQAVSAGVSVTYAPIDTGEKSASIYFWRDGRKHLALGARGKMGLEFGTGNRIPYLTFEITALYTGPVTESAPTPDLSGFTKPLPINKANTTCTVHTIASYVTQFSFDQQAEVNPIDVPGVNEIHYADRKPSGQMTWHAQSLATKDWFSAVADSDTGAFAMVHGTPAGAGRIVEFNGANVQLSNLSYADAEKVLAYQANTRWLPEAAGGGDYELVFR